MRAWNEVKFDLILIRTPADVVNDFQEFFPWLVVESWFPFHYTNVAFYARRQDGGLFGGEASNGGGDRKAQVVTELIFSIWTLDGSSLK